MQGALSLAALGAPAEALPRLRDDLRLLPAPREPDGGEAWMIFDPARNAYFRIGRAAFACLSEWHRGQADAVLSAAGARCRVTPEALRDLVRFLQANHLVECSTAREVQALLARARAAKAGFATWLLHHYLFLRIPLVRPDGVLERTLPWIAFVFRPWFQGLVLTLGALGVILALRQWDRFVHTFVGYLNLEGALCFGAALFVAKLLHELGHAYTAKRFGCRVPTMGVALLVLYPVLYTDTTDAWRLVPRRQRLLIGAAGMIAELGLALLATFAWSFLPDGPVRGAAFLLATATWLLTLAVNLSPCMRFDGYYLLSDLLGVPNLQSRGFALARWHLRETLFGLGEPPPEVLPRRLARAIILYGYGTWLYRLFLFLGIALLVYHFVVKLVGILLMAIELGWFLGRPIWQECRVWWRRRRNLAVNRQTLRTLLLLLLLLALAVYPWQDRVRAPAVLRAEDHAALYPPEPARITRVLVTPGTRVGPGEALIELELPDLEHRILQAERRLQVLGQSILARSASAAGADQLIVLQQELASTRAELAGLHEQRARLVVRSPIAGRVVDLPDALTPGLWVGRAERLAVVVGGTGAAVWAFVDADALSRVAPGAPARFYADDPMIAPVDLRVRLVDQVNAGTLPVPELASVHHGPIPVQLDHGGRLVPTAAIYRVVLEPTGRSDAAPPMILPGSVRIEGAARSLVSRLARRALAVLIRESGF